MASRGSGETGVDEAGEVMRGYAEQARAAVERFVDQVELERRMKENPLAVLGVAAAAGFVLAGGLWPVLRPFARAAVRTALSPANLVAIGAAIGALRAGTAGDGEEPLPGDDAPGTH